MVERLALVLVVCLLSLWKTCLAGKPAMDISDAPHPELETMPDSKQRACTVDELLPQLGGPKSGKRKAPEWSDDYVVEPPYNCTCATMRARYFCPNQGESGYPRWQPRGVASGACTSTTREELDEAPLPPNSKILVYGNSHMRQAVEAAMCMFQGALTSKRVSLGLPEVQTIVPGGSQCRGCVDVNKPDEISYYQQGLLDNGCTSMNDTCRCDDHLGEFFFENGAIVHYTFSHREHNKDLDDALCRHKNEPLSSYDAVFMNHGNRPSMSTDAAVTTAIEVQNAGAQFVWLSTYEGGGDINNWSERQRVRFIKSGAKFWDVHYMTQGMKAWTRGKVEGGYDVHYCLPGPPNEIALLMLKLLWAIHDGEKLPTVHEGDD